MKHLIRILLILSVFSGWAYAEEPILEIEDLDFDTIISPVFLTRSHKEATSDREDWFQFSLEYDVEGRGVWLDTVEVEWHVMLDSSKGTIRLGKQSRWMN